MLAAGRFHATGLRSAARRFLCEGRFHYVVGALVAGIFAVHLVTFPDELPLFYGDPYQYLLHAENLVEGRPYAATGYIQSPDWYVAPVAYPPGFPLLLAPVIALFGIDLMAVGALLTLAFVGGLWALAALLRGALPRPYVIGLVLVVGLHPYFWKFKLLPLSELPFLCAVALCLLFYSRATRDGPGTRSGTVIGLAVLAGLTLGFAIGTRLLGLVLLPTFVLHDLVRFRRLGLPLLVTGATVLVSSGLAAATLDIEAGAWTAAAVGEQGSYAELLQQNLLERPLLLLRRVPERLGDYARSGASVLWHVPAAGAPGSAVKFALAALSLGPVLLGLAVRFRHRFGVAEAFCVCYFAALLP
ncbi:MAG: hypothetical protein R3362_09160, partial [Rhodothermales bacterium]|nr:hypothetical protein [Rhodothermales bacterium]